MFIIFKKTFYTLVSDLQKADSATAKGSTQDTHVLPFPGEGAGCTRIPEAASFSSAQRRRPPPHVTAQQRSVSYDSVLALMPLGKKLLQNIKQVPCGSHCYQ